MIETAAWSAGLDPLTGLPDRITFAELTQTALDHPNQPHTVVCLRPTRAHLLDTLTPTDTDAIITDLATRIRGCLHPDDRVARISESTFAILTAGDVETATGLAHRIMLAVESPICAPTQRLHLPLAAGIAAAGAGPTLSAAELIRQAAIALTTIAGNPAAIAVFTPQMLHDHDRHLAVQEAVAHTLRTDPTTAIDVVYEPVIDIASGRLIGVAARADWRPDDHTTLSAGQLISLARETGLAARVDDVLLRTAISGFATWTARWPQQCRQLWVTVCAETLADADTEFPTRLHQILTEAGLSPQTLVLDPLDDHPTTIASDNLRHLRALGIRVATSHTLTLTDLREGNPATTEADFYDISPLWVDHCADDPRAHHLVQATIDHATARGAATAARQVTTVDQHEQLRGLGCAVARGPLYGPPQPHPATTDLLAAAAAGTWQTPVGPETRRRRSSRAWQQLRHVISSLPIAAFACNTDGNLILAEGALLDQLDLPAHLLDQPMATLLGTPSPRTGNRPLDAPLRQALRGRPTVTTIGVGDRWLQVHLCPRRGADRTITGALGVAIDVTHRIQAEHALRSSEQRFREVFAKAPVGMAIVAPDTRLTEANPTFATMLGYSPADLLGRDLASLWHPDTPAGTAEQYADLTAGRIPSYRAERAYRHRDGSPVWTRVTIGVLADAAAPGTVLALVEDLREVKRLEIELRHAQKLEAVGMLAAGIAHEINTPIQFIDNNINFLAEAFVKLTQVLTAAHRLIPATDDPLAADLVAITEEVDLPWLLEEVPIAADQCLKGVARVATIVRSMRNFGHPDQREPTPVDVNAAIRDTAIIARNEYKYIADLHLDLGDVPAVLGYPSEFHQVVLNLIVNAAHAITDAGNGPAHRGSIRVRSWTDATSACIAVTDDGCGMSPQTRARIFEPFYTTKEVGRGTGQGLTIVYTVVVEKHHGSIDVDSTPGIGTTFTIHLPLAPTPGGA